MSGGQDMTIMSSIDFRAGIGMQNSGRTGVKVPVRAMGGTIDLNDTDVEINFALENRKK